MRVHANTCKDLKAEGLYQVFPFFVPQLVLETASLMDLELASELQDSCVSVLGTVAPDFTWVLGSSRGIHDGHLTD